MNTFRRLLIWKGCKDNSVEINHIIQNTSMYHLLKNIKDIYYYMKFSIVCIFNAKETKILKKKEISPTLKKSVEKSFTFHYTLSWFSRVINILKKEFIIIFIFVDIFILIFLLFSAPKNIKKIFNHSTFCNLTFVIPLFSIFL